MQGIHTKGYMGIKQFNLKIPLKDIHKYKGILKNTFKIPTHLVGLQHTNNCTSILIVDSFTHSVVAGSRAGFFAGGVPKAISSISRSDMILLVRSRSRLLSEVLEADWLQLSSPPATVIVATVAAGVAVVVVVVMGIKVNPKLLACESTISIV